MKTSNIIILIVFAIQGNFKEQFKAYNDYPSTCNATVAMTCKLHAV